MAVAAVHGHCTARVLDRASFPVREAACGRGGLRAFGGPASRPEPSVDKTRPRRAVGIPGARPGPKTSRPTGRQKGGAGARAMLRDVTHAAVLRRPFPPHGNTQNTQHRTRHVFIPRSPDLSGAWPANRRAVDGHHRSPEVNHRLGADDGAPDNTATLPVRCDVATWSGGAWGRNLLRG